MASLGDDDQMAGAPMAANKEIEATNMLDDLKEEFRMEQASSSGSSTQNTDTTLNNLIKQKQLYEDNRATVVYDENEEDYDSEAESGEDEETR